MNEIDFSPLLFGKYKGLTPDEIADIDAGYIVWMYENIKPRKCSKYLAIVCEHDVRDYEDEKYELPND